MSNDERQPVDLWRLNARQRLRDLGHELAALDARLDLAVGHARDIEVPWEAIGRDLGRTRQWAQARFGKTIGPPDLDVRAAVELHEQGHLFYDGDDGQLVPMTYDDLSTARRAHLEHEVDDDDAEGEVS